MRRLAFLLAALTLLPASVVAQGYSLVETPIVTQDIPRFWTAFDRMASAETYEDTLRAFFEDYYVPGSEGLHDFIRARVGSVIQLVDIIRARPAFYASIRESTLRLRAVEPDVRDALGRWVELYPEAEFPAIYFVIGKMTTGGTTTRNRILIGSEMYARTPSMPDSELTNWHRRVIRPVEDVPYIVAHELIHTQQRYPRTRSLLGQSITEGIADLLGEMISGGNINDSTYVWAAPREAELWDEFQEVMHGTDRAGWLYANRKPGEPSDLGYWVGYQIATSFYERAADKAQAIRDMLSIRDFEQFLAESGYSP